MGSVTTTRSAVADERVEALCAGHFPGDPLVPGALLLALMVEQVSPPEGPLRIRRCVFRSPVRPGDAVEIEVGPGRDDEWHARVLVGPTVAAEAWFAR